MPLFVPHVLVTSQEIDPIPLRPVLVMQLAEFQRENERVFIGPHLMSAKEIDEHVDRLVDDAEDFRRLAKFQLDVAQTRATPR